MQEVAQFVVRVFLLFSCVPHAALGKVGRSGGDEEDFEGLRDCPVGVPDSVLNDCIQLALEDLRRVFSHGIPRLGVGPLDPLRIDQIVVWPPDAEAEALRRSPIQFVFHEIEARGISKYSRAHATINTTEPSVKLQFDTPEFQMDMRYTYAVRRRGGVRLESEGRMLVRLTNLKVNHMIFYRVEGQTVRPIRMTWTGTYSDLEIDLPHLRRAHLLSDVAYTVARRNLRRIFAWTFKNLAPPYIIRILEQDRSFVPALSYFFAPYFLKNANSKVRQ